jgi:predicted CoA-binding protein/RimJ/RimL family protein N-acetyltransferase
MSTIGSRPSAAAPTALPAYPSHHACDVVLRNGSTLRLRPIRAEDTAALQAFHQHLSPESLHLRFMSFAGATPAVAARLCTVDYANAFGFVGECGGTICAAAHYFRHERHPERAEVAFAVADALRGQGVGTKLLERLAAVAREHGIRVFTAQVLVENRPMLDVFFQSGYETSVEQDGSVDYVTLRIDATPAMEARSADRNEQAAAASMKLLFEPRSIAVIGASRNANHIGGAIFRNLWKTGFSGALYPIHPEATEIDGVKAWRTIADVPAPVDLAVIAVPAAQVARVVDECLAKGVRGMVVISAGFGEVSDDGRASERAMCWTITNAIPVSLGRLSKNRTSGSSPPAEAPIPTTYCGEVQRVLDVIGAAAWSSARPGSASFDIGPPLSRVVPTRGRLWQMMCPDQLPRSDKRKLLKTHK